MTGQLDIFTTSSRREPLAGESESPVTPAPANPGELASRREPSRTYEGTLGDDGSLHWMLTGQPEPRPA